MIYPADGADGPLELPKPTGVPAQLTGTPNAYPMSSRFVPTSRDDAAAFEREVRRVAGLLYPGDDNAGASMVDGLERDAIFVTDDTVIAIEATTSGEKAKAEKDGRKLKALTDKLARQYPYKGVKGFFITREDPSPHQLDVIRKIGQPVVAISFSKFRARLIDSKSYLDARSDYQFGSARDPETDDVRVHDEYIELDFVDILDKRRQYNIDYLIEELAIGRRIAVLGDFGAGKSMTLREIYLNFAKLHAKQDDSKFCLHLNLSDHQGQDEPSEALIRHATRIGFPQSHQLVRAWRSGEAHLILDGFDEVYTAGRATGSRPLEEIRKRSVELVRRFLRETPKSAGVVVAGRQHYFDNLDELRSSLAVPANAVIASATDFTA